jgi:hypothetical protein
MLEKMVRRVGTQKADQNSQQVKNNGKGSHGCKRHGIPLNDVHILVGLGEIGMV